METQKGVERWLVDISQWNPSHEEFSFILSILPLDEHSSITRFVQLKDRKRALISRLLQYALVHQVTKIPFNEISIKRTIEDKPYLENLNNITLGFANFNFNTSHDGDYVGIVSEPWYIVGLDIASLVVPMHENALEFVRNFASHFAYNEWEDIIGAGTGQDILAQFCRYWCLKEAFVKAIGAGVGYTLNRLEFKHSNWSNIFVCIDGEKSKDWEFSLSELGRSHWISIARGHPRNAVENYKRTLCMAEFEQAENVSSSVQFVTSFVPRTVQQLIPDSFKEKYSKYICMSDE
ncbi:L-aminoadipate-semialdehyde dehydrogenase-phosphopantetheinyl transferase [Thalictrum thalictroides]|uniref:holo-[acyl-carrier-protein] synthase n=1 Tax=Thalictrum thalictroides TaxID=46969 RepID=A0A7J6UTE4_THATH|nr:L-aminoadipate-semialdehyde dehydrogenase-phosphopantetheinyl transferase [Thalictrum thalictroides]